MSRLMLISNSKCYGQGYLDHCAKDIRDFLGQLNRVLFIPWAEPDLAEQPGYVEMVRARLAEIDLDVRGPHQFKSLTEALDRSDVIFVGGGNTFCLLDAIYTVDERDPVPGRLARMRLIRAKVKAGMPYIGTSAGSNLACPTCCTTNDMPIITHPFSLDALNLIPFQINPHYQGTDPESKHMGETRDDRIREFHKLHSQRVIGLYEGSWLVVEGDKVFLRGNRGAKIFDKGAKPYSWPYAWNDEGMPIAD